MILKQYYLGCLAHASYLLGDEESATAIVVDPQRDVHHYLADAAALGLRIRHVFLTHFHADFVAGHLELRNASGATIHLGARAQAEYAFVAMKDGDTLEFPGMRLQVLETPGHTIESISILVFDLRRDAEKPFAVLTGDTLFIGDVGRPDLRASLGWSAHELGGLLYDSLQNKLLPLPDDALIYPAHGAGSLCGKQISSETVSTLGVQKRLNYALKPMTREAFVRLVAADQPDAPSYFTFDAILNTRERETLDHSLDRVLRPIDVDQILQLANSGAQILDVRDPADYATGHLEGSLNIGLSGQYATWAGTLLDRSTPIAIIAEPGRELEAALRLGRIGFDHVTGYLAGGMAALASRPDLVRQTDRMSVLLAEEELRKPNPPLVLDVRTLKEWASAHVESSLNIPLNHLEERIAEIPADRMVLVHCAGGYRSSIAMGILLQHGFADVTELSGGFAAWEAARMPVISDRQD